MALKQTDVSISAKGNENSNIPKDKEIETKGLRWSVDSSKEGYSFDDFSLDLQELAEKFSGVTPARIAELFDSNVLNVRVYQDAGRNGMHDTGKVLSQDELDQLALERFTASGRGGARGPRLTDSNVIDAGLQLAKTNPAFAQLGELINNAKLTQLPEIVAQLRAAFTAAEFGTEQIKELAKAHNAAS